MTDPYVPIDRGDQMHRRLIRALAAPVVVAVLAAGCASSGGKSGTKNRKVPSVPMAKSVGAGEGQVNLVAWAGYVENGSDDPKVDWVTDFTKQTGCKVNVK